MTVGRRIATTDVPAVETLAQVDPARADRETIFAATRRSLDFADRARGHVRARLRKIDVIATGHGAEITARAVRRHALSGERTSDELVRAEACLRLERVRREHHFVRLRRGDGPFDAFTYGRLRSDDLYAPE